MPDDVAALDERARNVSVVARDQMIGAIWLGGFWSHVMFEQRAIVSQLGFRKGADWCCNTQWTV